MVLVLLGTQHNEFKRLLQEIEDCINNGCITTNVVVQAGVTKYKTDKMKIFDMMSQEILDNLVEDADWIITHGGVGSIIMALKKHKRVIAVPRLKEFNEHVNDHQRQIVNTFDEKGYLIGIQNVEDLPEAIKRIDKFIPNEYQGDNSKMLNIISEFINNIK